jgi:hypothetical protein
MRSETSPYLILAIFIVAGFIAIGYNLYLLTVQAGSGTRFAFFALGIVVIAVGVYIFSREREKRHRQYQVQATQPDLPKICSSKDSKVLPLLTPDQFYVMQQLFRSDYQIHVEP